MFKLSLGFRVEGFGRLLPGKPLPGSYLFVLCLALLGCVILGSPDVFRRWGLIDDQFICGCGCW